MISRIAIVAGLAGLYAGVAVAADLPSRRAPPAYVPPPIPSFTWTGAYFGINAGYAFSDSQTIQTLGNNGPGAGPTIPPANTSTVGNVATTRRAPFFGSRQDGFSGGGEIGYNFELKNNFLGGLGGVGTSVGNGIGGIFGLGNAGLVAGIEADAAYTDLRRSGDYVSFMNDPSTYRQRLEFLGPVRGRLGIAFDRLLIFGTGGFAYGGANYSADFYANNAAGTLAYTGRSSRIETGYAYGGGIEYALPNAGFLNVFNSSAVTIKAEYLHYDLGSRNVLVNQTSLVAANGSYTSRFRTEGNIVRAGLNYKFGSPLAAPVVARY